MNQINRTQRVVQVLAVSLAVGLCIVELVGIALFARPVPAGYAHSEMDMKPWLILGAFGISASILGGAIVYRRTRRDGDDPLTAAAWGSVSVFVTPSFLGIVLAAAPVLVFALPAAWLFTMLVGVVLVPWLILTHRAWQIRECIGESDDP